MSQKSARWQFRYFICLVASWCLLALGLYISGGGKIQPSASAVTLAWALCIMAVATAILSILCLPRQDRAARSWEPIVSLLMVGGASAMVVPVLWGSRGASMRTQCITSGKQVAIAVLIYSGDNNEMFPPSMTWMSAIGSYAKIPLHFKCRESKTPYDYALNSVLFKEGLKDLADGHNTVLTFECESLTESPTGGREEFVPRHASRGTMGFADGHAKMIPANATGVRWVP